jgi:hypothetical protein
MPFRTRLVVAAFAAAVSASHAAAQQAVQVTIPYNADVVREVGGTTTGGGIDPDTIRVDNGQPVSVPGGRAFVTQSEAAARDSVDPRGLPDNGVLQAPEGTIRLGPYDGNNAIRFGDFGANRTEEFGTFFEPGTYRSVQIYAVGASRNPQAPPTLIIRGQQSQVPGPTFFTSGQFDWKAELPADDNVITYDLALGGLDTTGPDGAGFEDVDGAQIVRWSYDLTAPGVGPVSGFTITGIVDASPFSEEVSLSVLAVTLTPVPEPSSALALACAAPMLLVRRRRSH